MKRRDLQEYDELSSDEYDDSDYQDDGSYEEEQYDDTYQDDEYDDGSYEEEQYDDGYEAESGPYDNENNEAYFSDQSDEKPVKKSRLQINPWRNDLIVLLVLWLWALRQQRCLLQQSRIKEASTDNCSDN